jgi:UDP-N-acetylmuramoyl-tripeptide--D-alanyl-D-alanine ligase
MTFWTYESIKQASGGSWAARGREGAAPRGASIDSRTLKPGQMFFALRGERVDGHAYLDAAAERGASLAVIDTPASCGDLTRFHGGMGVLVTGDTPASLLRLGTAARAAMGTTKVVSIGGSNGKTTTTRLIEAVLGTSLRGSASPKSFNNALGVPLTLLNASPSDAFVAAEVGTNAPGEIALLAGMVRPDVAVITSIGREHLEGLGSLEGVAREEAAILPEIAPGGTAVLNAEAPHLMALAKSMLASRRDVSVVTFGTGESADLRLTDISHGLGGLRVTINDRDVYEVPLIGKHNAGNAAAAIAVGRRFGLDLASINAGMARVKAPDHRLQRLTVGGIAVLDDAYNANPESMRAAIETFAEIASSARRRVVVLGDMLELGDSSQALHEEIGRHVAELRAADVALLVGPISAHTARAISSASPAIAVRHYAQATAATCDAIARTLRDGDAVLLKGSRGMGLDRVATALQSLHPEPSPATIITPKPAPASR